jgi:three-Cys-motif partner protein
VKAHESYRGREQTYLKHFFLERYLERVAFNILSFKNEFVYIDGFSGPWKSADEKHEDTSFSIAINQLRKVREAYKQKSGRSIRIRCLFNDSNPAAYDQLKRATEAVEDMEITTLCRDFEDLVPDIVKYAANSFTLTFIDPTGWTGFSLEKIQPLLRLRGEILINFMFDYVNRFLQDPRPETAETFNPTFGGENWLAEVDERMADGATREEAVLQVYCSRVRRFGGYEHVASTRILKPMADRSYFHLVYATRHWKGLLEFREVEKRFVDEQERVRAEAKIRGRAARAKTMDLFGAHGVASLPRTYEAERQNNLNLANRDLLAHLRTHPRSTYEELLKVLEWPLVWESDLKGWLRELKRKGAIEMPRLSGRATELCAEVGDGVRG